MASVSCVLSEDQLLCSICLEVFTDPVSTSCGHSFCKTCIYHHWDHSEQYQCPVCKEDFSSKPQLRAVNTPRLQRHHLICPHDKPLELFCLIEKTFICVQCTSSQHKDHAVVPLKEECERQQAELETLVKQRRQKIQEILDSVKVNNKNADQEMAEGVKVFSALMDCVQKSLDQFKERITGDQKKVEDRAAELIEELEQEVCVLQQRGADMKLVSEDHFSFLQTFSSVKPAPDASRFFFHLCKKWL
uniref:Uncharacterized protein n=1 Tax=Periophthalmus magnuspinnatus TaxID=409849 RepID=A0A3B3ZFC2_9GOBI